MTVADPLGVILWGEFFLPNNVGNKIPPPEHLITQYLQIMALVVVNGDPQRTILGQQPPDDLQPVPHQRQPDGMLDPVVIMGEGAAGVVRRIDEHAFDLAGKLLLQRLQRQQVVAKDQPVVEQIRLRHPMPGMIRQRLILQQDARLQPRPLLLADPGQLQFLFFSSHYFNSVFYKGANGGSHRL